MRTFVVSRSGPFFEEPVFTVGSVFCVVYLKHLVKLVVWSSRVWVLPKIRVPMGYPLKGVIGVIWGYLGFRV